jgi:thioredoxin reductase (NADPH)
MAKIEQLIILGSGPAGLTAGVYAARANLAPIIIDGPVPGGQLMSTTAVENWPGNKSILGPQLMANMREHAQHAGATILTQKVIAVSLKKKPLTINLGNGKDLQSHAVIIATGATAKRLNVPGENEYWGRGVTTCAACDGPLYKDLPVVIIGGGDTAMEDASFLTKYTNKITVIHILDALTASHAMQQKVLANKNIRIIYNTQVTEIVGDGNQLKEVRAINKQTKKEERIESRGVFIAIGLSPNTELFKGQLELTKAGHILVKNHTHTSIPGIFAAGDVADVRYRQAITSAGSGCMAAMDADSYLKSL